MRAAAVVTSLAARTLRVRAQSGAVIAALALVVWMGCRGSETARERVDPGRAAATTGTLELGDETYEFGVNFCYLEGEDNNESTSTLLGGGSLEDGQTFDVLVDRTTAGAWLHHSLRLDVGNVGAPGSITWETRRSRTGGSWTSFLSGIGQVPDEPLIRIEGNTVRAAGKFKQTSGPEEDRVVQGELEATCP